MTKVIKLKESDLYRIIKRVLTEGETSCDKTFDELKTNVPTNTSWTLQKIEGVWTLSSGDFCTKDIIIYGAGRSLSSGNINTRYERIDDVKNRVYFSGFNVGPKK